MFSEISLPSGLALRAAHIQDETFAEHLFSSVRDYLYQLPLPKAQLEILVKQQFQLQQAYYAAHFPEAGSWIICYRDQPVGRLILDATPQRLHIVDMAILKAMQGKGYGTAVLKALQELARVRTVPLELSVDSQNLRARKLYLSLGFALIRSSASHDCMRWVGDHIE